MPAVKADVANGSAIFLSNASDEIRSVAIVLRASKDPVVAPTVFWDGGQVSWEGSLGPDEKLVIAGDGTASVVSPDGEGRGVVLTRFGSQPKLPAHGSLCFGFQQARNRSGAHFEVTLLYAPDGMEYVESQATNIFARRLNWLADAYQVLPPTHLLRGDPRHPGEKVATRGFFADAHVRQMKMGMLPAWPAVDVPEAVCNSADRQAAADLIDVAKASIADATKLTGDARLQALSFARKAFVQALALCPDWKIEDVSEGDIWGMIAARKARAEIWSQLGNVDRMRAEYAEALAATPVQQADAKSYLHMLIGDGFAENACWVEAEEHYLKAEAAGLYGDRKTAVPRKLEQVRPLAEAQRR